MQYINPSDLKKENKEVKRTPADGFVELGAADVAVGVGVLIVADWRL